MTYDIYYAKRGDKGAHVKAVQRRLNEVMGTSLKIDGDYGVATQAVVRDFQVANHLATTSYIDPPTAELLGLDFSEPKKAVKTTNNAFLIAGAFVVTAYITKKFLLN